MNETDDQPYPITRPCCGATAPKGYNRATATVYLPHKRTCRYWQPTQPRTKTSGSNHEPPGKQS